MKYYIIAGEASGDLHGSNLVREIKLLDPTADIRSWGGPLMQAQGATVVKDYKDLAFMGFAEVVMNLRTILRNIKFCKQDILTYKPDVLVLVDYPGFNLRIAKWARQQGLKTVYYISPQIWAWKENRVHDIKRDVDKMLVILPFEKSFYEKWDYPVEYVGHPLANVIAEFKATHPVQPAARKIVALLPGSRSQEIATKLPVMLEVSKAFPDLDFIVAKAPGQSDDFYAPFLQPYANVSAVGGKTYDLLNQAHAALVTSGTATLETALFGVPQVVCYKGSPISYQIAKRVIKVKYISLVNLIMDKLVVRELIQHDMTVDNCIKELKPLVTDAPQRQQMLKDYGALQQLLAHGSNASSNAAQAVVEVAKTAASH